MIGTYEFIQKVSYAEYPDENGNPRTYAFPDTAEAIDLVRCKDCKHHGTMDCPMCEEGNCIFHTADNWYCADGERRTDDA